MAFKNKTAGYYGATLDEAAHRGLCIERKDYFFPPHSGRPPSDEAVREATQRYVEKDRK